MKKSLQLLSILLLGFALSSLATHAGADGDEREGGILGTGIVGTITELGSIFVNGQHIRFESKTPVADGVFLSQANELRPGHTVAVIAHPNADDSRIWRAVHIRQILPLVGPLQISDDNRYSVMGTNIITDGVALTAASGDWVAVSGLWQSGQVIATRIDRVDADVGARIEGSALDFSSDKSLRLGGTEILGLIPHHIQEGDVIRAFGTPGPSVLQVTKFETGVFDNETGVILAEGYMSIPRQSGFYTVLGTNFVSFTDNPAMIDEEIRFLSCGQNGALTASVRVSDDDKNYATFLSACLNLTAEEPPGQSDK